MGRRPGNPQDQAAMGNPGKRKSKTEKAIAEAERLAGLLAMPRSNTPSEAPPAFLDDPRLKGARVVWNDYAPRLDRLHLLANLDRFTFALFCVYAAEFAAANEDVLLRGYSVNVKTISGDKMPRENPAVGRRDFAAKMVLDLSAKFGLTAADRHKLLRDGAMHLDHETLFGREQPNAAGKQADLPPDEPEPVPAERVEGSAIGLLSNLDSLPPGKPN